MRWAWRLFRRGWRQQLLVLALIAVAVAATILGAAIGTNTPIPADAGFGTANHSVTLPGDDPHLAADIAAIKQGFGTIDVIENEAITTGSLGGAQLRAQSPNGPFGQPMLALVSGHYPAGPSELDITAQLAATYKLHVGSAWFKDGHTWSVVGLVENPQDLLDNFALVAPGQLPSPSTVTVLFDGSPASVAAFTFPDNATPQTPSTTGISPAVIVLVLAVFGLLFVGLVAVSGFTVLAQRRLRALGLLSSLGATDRNVRLVMVANGAVVGVVGALIGAALGLAAWVAYAPRFSTSVNHQVVWTNLPWWLIVTVLVLAFVTATLAARRPARSVAEIPVVAALSGRPVAPKSVRRSAIPGVILLLAGPGFLAFSGGWGGTGGNDTLLLIVGLLALAVGLLLFAPICVPLFGGVARRATIAVRLALRDLARYRARSGASLAAVSFAVLIAMVIGLVASGRYADVINYFAPNLPTNELIVYTPGSTPGGGSTLTVGPRKGLSSGPSPQLTPAELQAGASAIPASLGSHDILALESAGVELSQNGSVAHAGVGGSGNIYVATPTLLHHYGISPSEISPTTLLITSRPGLQGTLGLELASASFSHDTTAPSSGGSVSRRSGASGSGRSGLSISQRGVGSGNSNSVSGCSDHCVTNPSIQTFSNLPTGASDPTLLVTSYAVHKLGLQVTAAGWLIQTAKPLTAAQINGARQAAAATGMTIETKNDDPSLNALRNWSTAAGILLALGVLVMTVGLIRSETAGDLRTLTATGASSRTRRTITGATAGALGLLGAVLGTAVAYLAAFAFFRSQLSERMSNPPALALILILIGLPVVAGAGGWLIAGREPPAIAHQPIE
jgi:putative ABC transport system permease protein